jgi:hypothetical protein
VFTHLDHNDLDLLLKLYNDRACGSVCSASSWTHVVALLIPKINNAKTMFIDQFRPIAILPWTLKLYMSTLLMLVGPFIEPKCFIQYGNRKFHQAAELVHVLRIVLEKISEWSMPLIIISLDIRKAFDTILPDAIEALFDECKVPDKIKFAILQEILDNRLFIPLIFGMKGDQVNMDGGLRQGSPEAALLFSAVLSSVLVKLVASWKSRGMGIFLGKFDGDTNAFKTWINKYRLHFLSQDVSNLHIAALAFADDIYLLASSAVEAGIMLAEVRVELGKIGLKLQEAKLKWIANQWVESNMLANNSETLHRSESFTVLGSVVCGNMSETEAHDHRVSQSWKCFHKWQHILCAYHTPLKDRLDFWCKTVCRSLDWCLETCRANVSSLKKLHTAQSLQIAKMMGIKRKKLENDCFEPWIDWNKRRFRASHGVIEANDLDIRAILRKKRLSWAAHISRFGLGHREQHLIKLIINWRPIAWWRLQQQALNRGTSYFRHCDYLKPRRWEDQLPKDWLLNLCLI